MGISSEISLIGAEPSEEQTALFAEMIRTLRDSSTEYVIFDFQNPENGPDRQQGLVFYQVCREGESICAEVRIDTAAGKKMYRALLPEEEAAALLREMIRTREAPDITGWEDIMEEVFRPLADEDFE